MKKHEDSNGHLWRVDYDAGRMLTVAVSAISPQ